MKWIILKVLFFSYFADGYKILLLLPFPGPSHFLMFKVFIKELTRRGHEVTSISAFPYGQELNNYTEILIEPRWSFEEKFSQHSIFEMKMLNKFEMLHLYTWIGIESTAHALGCAKVQEFIQNDATKFDLIISEQFFQESMLMFAHKYKAPILTISTYGYSDFMDRMMGSVTPYSFVPHLQMSDYDDDMNFVQRAQNLFFSIYDILLRKFHYYPAMNAMAEKFFANLSQMPTIEELEKSVSVVLVNSHFAITRPRPLMPGMINIAGAHLKPASKLPHDINEFIESAEHGVIYMSLGSFLQSSNMPIEKLNILLNVFKSLKQRILWKYEKNDIENLPENIMIKKWLPQSDILHHSKVILFISHGGLYSTLEGTLRGVPFLLFPFYGDQYRNAKIVTRCGYGQHMLFNELTEESLRSKINEMIENENFSLKAKEISSIIQDNINDPLNESMYWIEYVVRHKGAKHLKSKALNLTWYQYIFLDLVITLFLVKWVVYKTICILLKTKISTLRKEKMN